MDNRAASKMEQTKDTAMDNTTKAINKLIQVGYNTPFCLDPRSISGQNTKARRFLGFFPAFYSPL
jgi:hypothetical protein